MNHKRHSIAQPMVFTSPADALRRDNRTNFDGSGFQGRTTCRECGATVTKKKAIREEAGENAVVPGIEVGDIITARHRPGGGRCSLMRGDVICRGAGLPA